MTLGMGSLAMASSSAFCRPVSSVAPLGSAVKVQGVGLAVMHALQAGHGGGGVGQVGTQGLQLFQQRGRGLALGRQAHGHGHELLAHGLVFGLEPDMAHMRGQRRGEA
jgi:hypothetical protein